MRLAVLVPLSDVIDFAAALLGRQGGLVFLVHAHDVDDDADVLEGVPGELGDGRDQVCEGGFGVEVGDEGVDC